MCSAANSYKIHCEIHSIQGSSKAAAALLKVQSRESICIDNVWIAVGQWDWLSTCWRLVATHQTTCRLDQYCSSLYMT